MVVLLHFVQLVVVVIGKFGIIVVGKTAVFVGKLVVAVFVGKMVVAVVVGNLVVVVVVVVVVGK